MTDIVSRICMIVITMHAVSISVYADERRCPRGTEILHAITWSSGCSGVVHVAVQLCHTPRFIAPWTNGKQLAMISSRCCRRQMGTCSIKRTNALRWRLMCCASPTHRASADLPARQRASTWIPRSLAIDVLHAGSRLAEQQGPDLSPNGCGH